jgi:hypothetical protein
VWEYGVGQRDGAGIIHREMNRRRRDVKQIDDGLQTESTDGRAASTFLDFRYDTIHFWLAFNEANERDIEI